MLDFLLWLLASEVHFRPSLMSFVHSVGFISNCGGFPPPRAPPAPKLWPCFIVWLSLSPRKHWIPNMGRLHNSNPPQIRPDEACLLNREFRGPSTNLTLLSKWPFWFNFQSFRQIRVRERVFPCGSSKEIGIFITCIQQMSKNNSCHKILHVQFMVIWRCDFRYSYTALAPKWILQFSPCRRARRDTITMEQVSPNANRHAASSLPRTRTMHFHVWTLNRTSCSSRRLKRRLDKEVDYLESAKTAEKRELKVLDRLGGGQSSKGSWGLQFDRKAKVHKSLFGLRGNNELIATGKCLLSGAPLCRKKEWNFTIMALGLGPNVSPVQHWETAFLTPPKKIPPKRFH